MAATGFRDTIQWHPPPIRVPPALQQLSRDPHQECSKLAARGIECTRVVDQPDENILRDLRRRVPIRRHVQGKPEYRWMLVSVDQGEGIPVAGPESLHQLRFVTVSPNEHFLFRRSSYRIALALRLEFQNLGFIMVW